MGAGGGSGGEEAAVEAEPTEGEEGVVEGKKA